MNALLLITVSGGKDRLGSAIERTTGAISRNIVLAVQSVSD